MRHDCLPERATNRLGTKSLKKVTDHHEDKLDSTSSLHYGSDSLIP